MDGGQLTLLACAGYSHANTVGDMLNTTASHAQKPAEGWSVVLQTGGIATSLTPVWTGMGV